MPSKIEWTEETWNPTTGCSQISPGCKHCYAKREWPRLSANPQLPIYHDRKFEDVAFHMERLIIPFEWKRPRRVFVNSMSDLFHENLSIASIARVFAVMALNPRHTFQVLTKRAARMQDAVTCIGPKLMHVITDVCLTFRVTRPEEIEWPLKNVWLGVSVENQKYADERIPLLLQTPAAVRWISAEPLLGSVEMPPSWLNPTRQNDNPLAWVVAGGESGPGARPMHPDWARSLRDQCAKAGVPFFFKQWGEWYPMTRTDGVHECPIGAYTTSGNPDYVSERGREFYAGFLRRGKKAAGSLLDGVAHKQYPAVRA
jgi:protein gp37